MTSPNLAAPHVAASQNQKEVTINDAINALDLAMVATLTLDCTAGSTISPTLAQIQRAARIALTGTPVAGFTLQLPAISRLLAVQNGTSQNVTLRQASGPMVDLAASRQGLIHVGGNAVTRVGARPEEAWDFGMTAFATPAASAVLGKVVVPRAVLLPANLAGARGHVDVAPTAAFEIALTRNGAPAGTITIDATGAFAFATAGGAALSIVPGDVLRFVAPATADTTVAGIALTLIGSIL
jgi:hypothetical protein